jgi:hypothetical protein
MALIGNPRRRSGSTAAGWLSVIGTAQAYVSPPATSYLNDSTPGSSVHTLGRVGGGAHD